CGNFWARGRCSARCCWTPRPCPSPANPPAGLSWWAWSPRCGPAWPTTMSATNRRRSATTMLNAAAELSVLEAVLHFFTYAVMAVFAENIVFSHGLGVSHLLKLVETRDIRTLHYCLPILLVQLLSAPLVWAARVWFTPW